MSIALLLGPDAILATLRGTTIEAIFAELCAPIARAENVAADELVAALAEREALASTAIGGGIAIPHGVHPGLRRVVGVLGRAQPGLALDAPDGRPVRLFFALLRPPDFANGHLKALARVSQLLGAPGMVDALLAAEDADAMRRLVLASPGDSSPD